MYLSFGILWRLGLLVAGFWWCKEILGRLREDVSLIRDKAIEPTQKGVVIGLWAFTVVIVGTMVMFGWGVAAHFIYSIYHPAAG